MNLYETQIMILYEIQIMNPFETQIMNPYEIQIMIDSPWITDHDWVSMNQRS